LQDTRIIDITVMNVIKTHKTFFILFFSSSH
jgi:hypothetical protein